MWREERDKEKKRHNHQREIHKFKLWHWCLHGDHSELSPSHQITYDVSSPPLGSDLLVRALWRLIMCVLVISLSFLFNLDTKFWMLSLIHCFFFSHFYTHIQQSIFCSRSTVNAWKCHKQMCEENKVSKHHDPNNPPVLAGSLRPSCCLKIVPNMNSIEASTPHLAVCVFVCDSTVECECVCIWGFGLNALTFHWIAVASCHDNADWNEHNACMCLWVCVSMPFGSNWLKTAASSIQSTVKW